MSSALSASRSPRRADGSHSLTVAAMPYVAAYFLGRLCLATLPCHSYPRISGRGDSYGLRVDLREPIFTLFGHFSPKL
jgi:hypothetical protein